MNTTHIVKNVSPPGIETTPDTKTTPSIAPAVVPETEPHYAPDPDHCPQQRVRTVRRIRRIVEP